jgi:hypothetical protein
MNNKPTEEPLKHKAGGADGSTLTHANPVDSTSTIAEEPKDVQNAQLNLEPEPKDGFSPVHSNHAVSSIAVEPGSKSLWDEAYHTLREKNSKLIDAYEKDLLASQNSNQQGMLVRMIPSSPKAIRRH